MNCKQGDMARLIKAGRPENVNLIVEVLEPASPQDHGSGLWSWRVKPAWPTRSNEGWMTGGGSFVIPICPDAWLRPIRPDADPVTTDCDVGVEA